MGDENFSWHTTMFLIKFMFFVNALTCVVVPSLYIRSALIHKGRMFRYANLFFVVSNPLSRRFSFTENVDHHNSSVRNVIVIGRLSPQKGQHRMLEAARALPEINFFFCGETLPEDIDYAAKLKTASPSNIYYDGFVYDLASYVKMNSIRISVMPSVMHESFGLAAIETMSLGCVNINSAAGALFEVSQNTGALTFENTDDLIEILDWLVHVDPMIFDDLAAHQKKMTDVRYSFESFRESLLSLPSLS